MVFNSRFHKEKSRFHNKKLNSHDLYLGMLMCSRRFYFAMKRLHMLKIKECT